MRVCPLSFPFSPRPQMVKTIFPALCLSLRAAVDRSAATKGALAVIQPFTPVINGTHTTAITLTGLLTLQTWAQTQPVNARGTADGVSQKGNNHELQSETE